MFGFNIIYDNSSSFSVEGDDFLSYISEKKEKQISFSYRRFTKFNDDKIFKEDKNFIFGIDGVILNLSELKNSYGISDYFKLIKHLWHKKTYLMPNDFKGEFTGFIFDKSTEKLFVFCNQTATKAVYYSKCKGSFMISSDVSTIVAFKAQIGVENILNKDAVYSMFTYGAMLENETLVKGITRLNASEYIVIDGVKLLVNKYQDFNEIGYSTNSKKQNLDLLENSFEHALKLEYQKDLEYGYDHIATLSGGLDSRMNVMLANNMGFKNDVFCFSQSNYLDEQISREISKKLDLKYQFIPLDEGNYFKNIRENVEISRGTVFYLSAAHFNYSLEKINLEKYGLVHSGLIGDAILGGFISNKPNDFILKKMSTKFNHKVRASIDSYKKYSSEETLKLQNRIFNLINVGAFTVENHQSYLVSPFMDVDFINTCLSIPPDLKRNGKLYLEWINKYHPELTKYKWERTGFKPTHFWKTNLSRYSNKIKLEYFRLLKKEDRLSMTPVEFWFRNNEKIQLLYKNYFDQYILLVDDSSLRKDFEEMFKGNVFEKAMVITVLNFIKENNISI
ncbi:MAG: hypothetical protein PSN34_08700 [Urechidicola sp.]|nr:hypothetical protein [Urechidicola sp.]